MYDFANTKVDNPYWPKVEKKTNLKSDGEIKKKDFVSFHFKSICGFKHVTAIFMRSL